MRTSSNDRRHPARTAARTELSREEEILLLREEAAREGVSRSLRGIADAFLGKAKAAPDAVREHPWISLGSSLAAGLAAGTSLGRRNGREHERR